MDIKYFKVATLIATGLFVAFITTARHWHRDYYLFFYLVSLVVIWGSYFILSEKKIDLLPKDKHGGINIIPIFFVLIIIILLMILFD